MAITIIPATHRKKTLSQMLASGLEEGAPGAIESLRQGIAGGYNYKNLVKAGMDPNEAATVAFQPKEIGVAALKQYENRRIAQQKEQATLFAQREKQQRDYDRFEARLADAYQMPINPVILQNAVKTAQTDPEFALNQLDKAISIVGKGKPAEPGFWKKYITGGGEKGVSPYFAQGAAASSLPILDKLRQQRTGITPEEHQFEQIQRIINDTPEKRQQQRQELYNAQLQQEMATKQPHNTLDVINNAAAQQVLQQNAPQEVSPDEKLKEEARQEAQQYLDDPNVHPAVKQELRNELMALEPKSWGEYLAGIPANIASGAAQAVGTGFGLFSALEQNALQSLSVFSPEHKEWLQEAIKNATNPIGKGILEQELKNLERRERIQKEHPNPIFTPASIKENIVQPIAEALGVERLIRTEDAVNAIAERIGNVTPQIVLSSIMSGGPLLGQIAQGLRNAGIAEAGGEMTTRITGSEGAGAAITALGYLTSGFRPAVINKAIKSGYEAMDKLVKRSPTKRINAEKLVEKMNALSDELAASNSGSAKFLKNRMQEIGSKISNVSQEAATRSKIPKTSISAEQAYILDKEFGGDVFEKAQKIGAKTANRLTELRKALRTEYQPYYKALDPETVRGFEGARDMKASLHFRDELQDKLESWAKGSGGFFSKLLFGLRKAIGVTAVGRKWYKILQKSPAMRKEFVNILKKSAANDKHGALAAINRFNETANKELNL